MLLSEGTFTGIMTTEKLPELRFVTVSDGNVFKTCLDPIWTAVVDNSFFCCGLSDRPG